MAGINIPLGEISGDFFDYIPIKDKLYFTLGDVSGKGVNAGIVMAKASTLFKIFAKYKPEMPAPIIATFFINILILS